jgi:hypothetical protein
LSSTADLSTDFGEIVRLGRNSLETKTIIGKKIEIVLCVPGERCVPRRAVASRTKQPKGNAPFPRFALKVLACLPLSVWIAFNHDFTF